MRPWHDMIDRGTGYPLGQAKPEEMLELFNASDITPQTLESGRGGIEYVFVRT
jgi:hypothetical protein